MSGSQMPAPNPGVWATDGARPSSVGSNDSAFNSPDPMHADPAFLGAVHGPAPSIMSRDSTHGSLAAPSIAGMRSSWGSSRALAAAEQLPAGFEAPHPPRTTSMPRAQSGLSQSYTSPFPDDVNNQGHFEPSHTVPTTDKEVPRWAEHTAQREPRKRKWLWAILVLAALAVIGLALGLGLGLAKPWAKHGAGGAGKGEGNDDNSKGDHGTATNSADATKTSAAAPEPTTGGDGSQVTFEDGTKYTYTNKIGGFWVWDPADPFNNNARCNSWTRPLNETWKWGVDKITGVNLGGWLNTEPFIVPGLYEKFANGPAPGGVAVDEFTLSMNMGDKLKDEMTNHYNTFITEQDFAEIAQYGLNWVRLPMAHWALKTWEGEPFLEGVSWNYVLKAIGWARKYGLRVNLDLHTVPGSQNGWNHSGRLGLANWLSGPMGLANAQRSLDYMRTLAQFISQPEYLPVVQLFGFINEPNGAILGQAPIAAFYSEAYNVIRAVTGVGEGKGPMLSMHDAFVGIDKWTDFMRGADRLALDQHPYLVFQDQITTPITDAATQNQPCTAWAAATNNTMSKFGAMTAGEWSAAINDCGQWVNGVNLGQRYDGTYAGYQGKATGSCDKWNDYRTWDDATKQGIKNWVMASMDALQDSFFWTWKIGNSTGSIPQPNPFWHYRLGVQQGWIPSDPREAQGHCIANGAAAAPFAGLQPWMTGGAGAGSVTAGSTAFPPPSFTNVAAGQMQSVFQYTATADPITAPAPTFTKPGSKETIPAGSGWANPSDSPRKAYAPVSGCQYMDEYNAASSPVPAGACGAGTPGPTGV